MGKKRKGRAKSKIIKLYFNILNFQSSNYYLFNVTKYNNLIDGISDLNEIKIKDEEIILIKNEIDNCISLKRTYENKISIKILPEFFESFNELQKPDLKNSDYAKKIKYIIDFLKRQHKNITLKQIAKEYSQLYGNTISITTVSRILKNHLQMKYLRTSLKNPKLEEYNYVFMSFSFLRIILRSIILKFNIIFVDETGFLLQNNKYYSWREAKEQIYAGPKNKNKDRLNLILAVSNKNVIHKKFLNGSVNSDIFLDFLKEMYNNFKKDEQEKLIIIMDNATYHLSNPIIDFFKTNKIKGLTICPYKSEFNMIELVFRFIKNIIYKNIYNNIKDLEIEVTQILNSQNLKNSLINLYRETLMQYLIFIQNHNYLDLNEIMNKIKNP